MDPFEVTMNKALQKLAADIIPREDAKVCADNIIELLQTKSKFDIGRVCIAGSIGKKLTIIGSDIDFVLFINDERPMFGDVLEDFDNILTMTDSFNIRDVHVTKYSIQFKALGFEFDVLPAANFTKGLQLQGDTLIDIQQQRVLEHIAQDPKKYGYMYSSSLAEAAVRFMKQQDGFVNEMVRIAKFWFKTLHLNDLRNRSGAKNCIELIAVYVAKQEENMETKSYLRSFKRFIDYLKNFDNLNIHFETDEHRVLNKSRPRVMDPVNPYNNLAKNWDRQSIQLVKAYAHESNRRLEVLANSRAARLDQLFEPQPVYRPDMGEMFERNPTKIQWLVGTETFSRLPDLKVRNERFHTDHKLWGGLENIKKYFQFAILASTVSSCDENEMKEVVLNTISRQIYNSKVTRVSAEGEKHEDYDVTFTIPSSNQTAIRISYRL
ncbi:2'-5'-oligoadenylate synthase 1A-like [Sitodiplosis mosellana]|uniref:2'-5'-oligoadenylate synthase 1A-like n=1 Tax=Sitodiplosis mosellana TaxID=263140 RepID=UPI002444AEF5|nr:2'-5'-oligoadenylate synthase 1A-like [Sitodiplosis mosellana]XP_055298387.1 2'-5'-oligoadenylate synthase 1A-like [Sitodiplosis mosellana]XP_055298388.1 2'-5'-oligoadenylate synthase 1A-like [Sitodiplosis mosellana]